QRCGNGLVPSHAVAKDSAPAEHRYAKLSRLLPPARRPPIAAPVEAGTPLHTVMGVEIQREQDGGTDHQRKRDRDSGKDQFLESRHRPSAFLKPGPAATIDAGLRPHICTIARHAIARENASA